MLKIGVSVTGLACIIESKDDYLALIASEVFVVIVAHKKKIEYSSINQQGIDKIDGKIEHHPLSFILQA